MGWQVGFDPNWKRDVGYGVPALCDHPDCGEEIDRGLSYVCGNEPFGGETGCGLFFCYGHKHHGLCERCTAADDPFEPTPDVAEWTEHKATDPSWAEWRATQTEVA